MTIDRNDRQTGRETPSATAVGHEHDRCEELSPELREAMIRYVINTQALEGIDVSYEEVAKIVDEVYRAPLIDLREC
jgi:hypothetical protein